MSNKINDLLKKLSKPEKVTKQKFKRGKAIKIPSLLGATKPKSIKPKHIAIPLTGRKVRWHIAIGLLNIPHKKKTLYKSYIPRGSFKLFKPPKPPKLTKEQIKAWRAFGRGVFVGRLKPHVNRWGREYLYGYAKDIIINKDRYKPKDYLEAQNYLLVHERLGAPDLTKQYFVAKYGTAKVLRLSDDETYRQLLQARKLAENKRELRTIESLIKKRKKQLSATKAEYFYLEYRRERLEEKINTSSTYGLSERANQSLIDMEAKLLKMKEPSTYEYWNRYIRKELGLWITESAWGTDAEFMRAYYAKHDGLDPGLSIGRGREKYAYEKLIKWFIETGLEVPLHSTNLTHLKNPRLVHAMRVQLAKHFDMEIIDKYIKDNLTNPENLSRTGVPDPGVNWHSQGGYYRKTPRGAYWGQDYERAVTRKLESIEIEFTKQYNKFAHTDRAAREKLEGDFLSYIPPADMSRHFHVVLEHKREKKAINRKQNKSKRKKE